EYDYRDEDDSPAAAEAAEDRAGEPAGEPAGAEQGSNPDRLPRVDGQRDHGPAPPAAAGGRGVPRGQEHALPHRGGRAGGDAGPLPGGTDGRRVRAGGPGGAGEDDPRLHPREAEG